MRMNVLLILALFMIVGVFDSSSDRAEQDLVLSDEHRVVFMEVMEESLRIQYRSHMFNWLQRGVQYLLAHEVMLLGVRSAESSIFDYEYFTSSRYFGDAQFQQVLNPEHGVVHQAFDVWSGAGVPVFVDADISSGQKQNHVVLHMDQTKIIHSELKRFVVHGYGDSRSKMATLVMFGRLGATTSARTAYLLELLMPHLHCAILKVTSNKSFFSPQNAVNGNQGNKKLTKRESEVLQWLQVGKTNWEISSILEVSPLTVKNHVQNILRKLEVDSRSQAVVKATKMGLIVRGK